MRLVPFITIYFKLCTSSNDKIPPNNEQSMQMFTLVRNKMTFWGFGYWVFSLSGYPFGMFGAWLWLCTCHMASNGFIFLGELASVFWWIRWLMCTFRKCCRRDLLSMNLFALLISISIANKLTWNVWRIASFPTTHSQVNVEIAEVYLFICFSSSFKQMEQHWKHSKHSIALIFRKPKVNRNDFSSQ